MANHSKCEPAFDFTTDESRMLLHQCSAEMSAGKKTYNGQAEIWLDLLPRASVHVYGRFNGVPQVEALHVTSRQAPIKSFCINGREVEGFATDFGGDGDAQELRIKWCPGSEPVIGVGNDSTKISRVAFHLFNFVNFFGDRRSSKKCGDKDVGIHHIDLMCEDWKVELKSLPSSSAVFKVLDTEGGYGLTHIGCFEKKDGTSFSGKEAEECLYALRFFLSFAKGAWCEPALAVGFDFTGNRVWESWASPQEPWYKPFSWIDLRTTSQLAIFFPLFMKMWSVDNWRETLHEIIYWYISANDSSRGIDTGIILTQAAIERLSYEFAVKDRLLLTGSGFKGLLASDKFRILLASLKIPTAISPSTLELIKLKERLNWLDAPHALTEIRNSLIHPDHKRRGKLDDTFFEAWKLGLWYLELAILAVCNYPEKYKNRLIISLPGQVENVPWK